VPSQSEVWNSVVHQLMVAHSLPPPKTSEAERLNSAPALGPLSSEKMLPLLLPRRLRQGPHLDDCARLNGLQGLGAGGEVRL